MDAAILDALGDAVVVTDLAGRILRWNRAAEQLYGWPTALALGEDLGALLAVDLAKERAEIMDRLGRGETWSGLRAVRRRDGTRILIWATDTPLPDATGALMGVIAVHRDRGPVLNASARLAPDPARGRILGASLDYARAVRELTSAVVPTFADLCALVVLDEPDGPRWVANVAADPASQAVLEAVQLAPLPPRARAIADDVMRRGRVRVLDDIAAYVAAQPAAEAYDAAVTGLATGASIIAPLRAHGHAIGVISFAMTPASGRAFGPDDPALAEEIGHRIGLAIDNARLHTALRRSEARLRLATLAAPVVLFTQDRELRYTWRQPLADPAAPVLGRTDGELLDDELLDDASPLTDIKRGVLRSGIGARAVVPITIAGRTRHFDMILEPTRDDADQIVGLTGAAWDVSEQLRLEGELRAAEAHVRRLIDEAPEAYARSGPDRRFVDVNAAAIALLGYDRAALLTMDPRELVVPEDQAALAAAVRGRPPGEVVTHELRVRRGDGRIITVELRAKALAEGGRQTIFRDVTDRVAAERARAQLLAVEQAHRSRLEHLVGAALAIAPIDERGPAAVRSVLRRVVERAPGLVAADAAAIGLGDEPDAPLGPWLTSAAGAAPAPEAAPPTPATASPATVFPGRALAAFLAVPLIRDGRPIGQLYLGRAAGQPPFSADDTAVLALLAAHAAVAIENARLYTEREAAVRAREELLAVVSHDLRNPLRAIELRAELLARTRDEPELRAHAATVGRTIASMRRLIQNLLDANSLGLDRLRLDVGHHDLRAIFDEVVEPLAAVAHDRGVRVEVRVPEISVRGDRERLAQMFANLLGNAVRFTPAGGQVSVTARVSVEAIEVVVADSGPGIPAEDRARVFDRYFTTALGHEGAGLGLYIARGVVEAHGGRIWIGDDPAPGCAIHVALPLAPAPGAAS